MSRKSITTFCIALVTLGAGCNSTQQKSSSFEDVQSILADRGVNDVRWNRSSSDDVVVEHAVDQLLAHDLTIAQAQQIALLNNRNLQATFEEIGIAQADLVQAGLLRNPVFDASIRFPDGGGKTDPEFSVAENFLDLLALPLRKRVAAAALETTKLRVANEALRVAAEVESAAISFQSLQQSRDLLREISKSASFSLDAAKRIHEAGNLNDLDLSNQESRFDETLLDLAQAESRISPARERLNVLMGLYGARTRWTINSSLQNPPSREIELPKLETFAIERRLDLAASRQAIVTAARSLGAARPFAFVSEAEIGVDTERDVDTPWVTGPTLSIPIPLFDRGQGTIPKLVSQLRASQQRHYAQAVEVRAAVRSDWSEMSAARDRFEFLNSHVVPLKKIMVEQTQRQFNAMGVNVFQLLSAQQMKVDSQRQAIEALRDYWLARLNLRKTLGGRFPPDSQG